MANNDELIALKKRRSVIKSACTRIKTYVDSITDITPSILAHLEERKVRLEASWSEYNETQLKIEAISDEEVNDRTHFEEAFFNLSAKIRIILNNAASQGLPGVDPSPPPAPSSALRSDSATHVRLPKLNLPVFTGKYEDWFPFYDSFKTLINDNASLTGIEKFQYLKSSLRDEASGVIQSLEISDQNYAIAWNLLKERYDNKRTIVQTHLRAIFELPSSTKENAAELRQIADGANKHIRALAALQRPTEQWDDVIIYILSSKLDSVTSREWQSSLKETELPTLKEFFDFLSKRCRILESTSKNSSIASQQDSARFIKKRASHIASVKPSCGFCNGEHLIYYCNDFIKLPVSQRLTETRKRKLCTNCLRPANHPIGKCKSGACRTCHNKHNTLLHQPTKDNETHKTGAASFNAPSFSSEEKTISTNTYTSVNQCMLLSTAVVYVIDSHGNKHTCRALLDNGSQANFVSRSLVDKLQLKTRPINIHVTGINGTTQNITKAASLQICSRIRNFSATLECIVTDRITERLPLAPIRRDSMQIPHNIKLADPEFYRPSDIDLLIGVELFWKLLCIGQIKASCAHPTLQKTQLGWILAGRLDNTNSANGSIRALHATVSNSELQKQLSAFWQLEELPRTQTTYTIQEQFCENHFIRNVSQTDDGRVIVKLPIKEHLLHTLGDTRALASRRLQSIERRLEKDPHLKSSYTQFMTEYQALGHMHLVDETEDRSDLVTYHLPHHCVINESSKTTKLRVVFDGSFKSDTGASLNDLLMIGPIVQQDLIAIIMRFRTFKFVFTADIIKMYRQILIDHSQTSLQRILWREDPSKNIKTYELQTLTYGTSAASYLSTRSLKYLAERYANEYPRGAERVIRDFYVDDLLTGADTLDDAIQIRTQIIQLLNRGLLQLSKWASNHEYILNGLENASTSPVELNKDSDSRVLGILWNPTTDTFRFSIYTEDSNARATKRTILSEISKIFDPLGLLGPVVIIPKLIMQKIWQANTHWDESIPLQLHTEWSRFKSSLPELNKIEIPRYIKFNDPLHSMQIHGFCDASQSAYGACVYLRSHMSNNDIRVELLCSKTRVAPLKAISLPRLELCAAVLLSQLIDKVHSSLGLTNFEQFLWSDSTITLNWIRSSSRRWSVFVANRVGEIQRITDISEWRHVPSKLNPADLLSRGVTAPDLITSSLWWHGPEFLKQTSSQWPKDEGIILEDSEMPELRKLILISTSSENSTIDVLINEFSNLDKVCRILAYCLRFIQRRVSNEGRFDKTLLPREITSSLHLLCRTAQKQTFPNEIKLLKVGKPLNSNSPLLSLSPFLDDEGLLRVGGRLRNSGLSCDVRHPILLPKNHKLTYLIIEKEHRRNLHAGIQGTLASVRQGFWPLSGRSVTRKVVRRCIKCFRCRPVFSEAQMGALPTTRVTPSKPFSYCGVDYAGPIILREGKRRNAKNYKAYISIFVCFCTKAVHIELVNDLSTDSFLGALKRFISRRGKPVSITSDNGTNFVGASRELSDVYKFYNSEQSTDVIREYLRDAKIDWNFIPPGAPHQGGLWEAAVKSAKTHMHRIIGQAHLTYEEMLTLLCEIEAILNSRPLTPLTSDANDFACLTPGHFLVGSELNSFPCHDLRDINENRLVRWQRVESLRQHFWSRWRNEYLNHLQQRNKWKVNKGEQLKSGQLVVIKQQNLLPLQWQMGRVQEVHFGPDGIARSATVKTATGVLVRPLTKLAILPIET